MKLKYFALSMAFVMAVALTGCSAGNNTDSSAPVEPTDSASVNSVRPSTGVDGDTQNSASIGSGAQNSAGVGGNSGQNSVSGAGNNGSVGDDVIDDIGDAAGDLARGAGNVVRGAGNAIGNAANDIGGAMR